MFSQTQGYKMGEINDGFFELSFKPDGVYITVYPPLGKGKRVAATDVMEKLSKKQIRNFDRAAIDIAVMKANQTPQKIADPQDEKKIDAAVTVNVAPDKMKATIFITPPEGGRMLTLQEIMEKLTQNGIVYGINTELINNLSQNPTFNQQILIAEGTAPINGTNGKVEFHFNLHKDTTPTIMEDGRVNFRELNLIENVNQGQILVTTTEPTAGQAGKNIVGGIISALNGKPAVLPKGKNVEITEEGNALIASISGQVNYIDGKVSVFSLYEVPADVDNSTGNIYFVGNVIVRGNVLSGFNIEAGGNVEVFGVVEGASIRAGGNIVLRRGMQGLGKGTLLSGGDIVARYIEHSTIQARGDIKAEAIMHSIVKCGNKLELSGKKGLLVGGSAKVGREVVAKMIGSSMATLTEIEVGVDPELRDRYRDAKEEMRVAEIDIKKAEQAIEILGKLDSIGKLPPDKKEIYEKSIRTRMFYTNKLNELREEIIMLEDDLEQESNGKIVIQNVIYPGSKVAIGTSMLNVRENIQYCTLYRDGADIRVGAFK